MDFDSYLSPDAEKLLRTAAARYGRLDSDSRALLVEGSVAVLYAAAAVVIAVLAPEARSVTTQALVITVVAYVAASRVRFPVGSAWLPATQIVFVPMLFLLPARLVPIAVVSAQLIDLLPQLIRRRASLRRALARFGDSAYCLGPVLVLIFANDQRFAWGHWPIYLLAFVAQVLSDLASGLTRTWLIDRIRPSQQKQMAWLYATDACLSCAGLLVAASASRHVGLVLLALPLIGLLGLFARERSERMENTLALSTAYRGTAMLLGDVIEDDDEYTGIHSRQVVDLAVAVSERLGLDATQRRNVEFGALLHDVGKIRVPKEIIRKPGKLDDAEWAIMREHTVYGEQMLNQVGGTLSSVGKVVRHSHERYDGTGYPDGLVGEMIPVESRIVCACDAFNAMTTNRPYRPALTLPAAITEMERCSGTHFDPKVVYALLAEVAEHPPAPVSVPRPEPLPPTVVGA